LVSLTMLCAFQIAAAQTDVVWNPVVGANLITGSVPATTINVNVSLLPGGNPVSINSPAPAAANLNVPNANNTFSTSGPNQNDPSQSLSFQFSQPVIITRFTMADIDLGVGIWNDSFTFANGFSFAQF